MSYAIQRWDVLSGDNIQKFPAIYVIPDTNFIEFIRNNEYNIICLIDGTGSPYDGMYYNANVSQSSDMPNCRPNFFLKTGMYIITLNAQWMGYPCEKTKGTVTIYGRNMGIPSVTPPKPPVSPSPTPSSPRPRSPSPRPRSPSPRPRSPSPSPTPSSPRPRSPSPLPRSPSRRMGSPRSSPQRENYKRNNKKLVKLNGTGREDHRICSIM